MPSPDVNYGHTALLIYALDGDIIPGPYPPRPDSADLDWYNAQLPVPVLTKREQEQILWHGRLALHGTYSMQQDVFRRIGCVVENSKVILPKDSYVVGIAARDRYDIFAPVKGLTVITYETVEEWRENRDADREGWTV